MRRRIGTALASALLLCALGPASASAQIIGPQDRNDPQVDSPWQAGTCKADPPSPGQCSVGTPSLFYEQAAGHPPVGFTQFIVNTEPGLLGPVPIGNLKTVRVDLPPGLTVNPQATEQCELTAGESPSECATSAPGSKVGTSELVATNQSTGVSAPPLKADVYDIVPNNGEPARFGFTIAGNDVYLEADVAWENDFHEYFTIHVAKVEVPPIPGELARVAKNRLVFDGTAGNGTFITTPGTCFGEGTAGSPFEQLYSTWLRADSYEEPDPNFPNGSAFVESPIPPGTEPRNCDDIPYEPSLDAQPGTQQTDSPAGASLTVNLPEITNPLKNEANKATSHTRSASATLPAGIGLNPSAAQGLVACTDAEFGKGTRNAVACPPASKIGTVAVETPPLPPGSLTGSIYVGQQLSNDPTSGDMYRIFVTADSDRFDIHARLLGKVHADPQTGQLTTTFDDGALGKVPVPGLPQVPFTAFKFDFNGGPRAPLSSPFTCGPHRATTLMTPWSGNPPVEASDEFSLSKAPGGGDCPKSLGERPFGPEFLSARSSSKAGAFTTLTTAFGRGDGEQELKGAEVKLPPGLSARLKGLKYCPASALAAAAANGGAAEAANPSCPDSSLVGSATVLNGTGGEPIKIEGKAFLAGPYNGAPLSLAIVTPATAGPFDLGTVVVRVALFLDRETARVTAVSDPIPHIFGGARLDVRSINLRLDRPHFSINPTNCSAKTVDATMRGGGANPADPAAFTSFTRSLPFEIQDCDKLGFGPKLSLRLSGQMRRTKNPKLSAVVVTNPDDANIAAAVVTLPKGLILDQSSIGNVCTRVQFAANQCPSNSVIGFARASTPLLAKPLEGPVYLRSSDNVLPDVVAALRGQVDIDLVGRNDSVHGRLRNTFAATPDVPVERFELIVKGGKKGLLQNTRNLCPRRKHKRKHGGRHHLKGKHHRRHHRRKPMRATAVFYGQNGKKVKERPKVARQCGKKHHKKRRHHRARG